MYTTSVIKLSFITVFQCPILLVCIAPLNRLMFLLMIDSWLTAGLQKWFFDNCIPSMRSVLMLQTSCKTIFSRSVQICGSDHVNHLVNWREGYTWVTSTILWSPQLHSFCVCDTYSSRNSFLKAYKSAFLVCHFFDVTQPSAPGAFLGCIVVVKMPGM